jgi:ADP-dependent phosphofructokinase/glucokinase
MTVEELKAQLQGTLQEVKTYIDVKDGEIRQNVQNLQDSIDGLGIDEDTLANIQNIVDNLDVDTINDIAETKLKVGNLIEGLGDLKNFAQNLFATS